MMEMDPDEIELSGLDNLAKALKVKTPPYAKIGVLGKNVARDGKGSTNSEIGAAHEYGSPEKGLPSRSFLRMPLTEQFPKKLEETELLGEDELKEVLAKGTLVPWLRKCAVLAVATVKEAFATNGFGRWQELDIDYEEWKDEWYGTGQILVASGQLKDAITEEVVEP